MFDEVIEIVTGCHIQKSSGLQNNAYRFMPSHPRHVNDPQFTQIRDVLRCIYHPCTEPCNIDTALPLVSLDLELQNDLCCLAEPRMGWGTAWCDIFGRIITIKKKGESEKQVLTVTYCDTDFGSVQAGDEQVSMVPVADKNRSFRLFAGGRMFLFRAESSSSASMVVDLIREKLIEAMGDAAWGAKNGAMQLLRPVMAAQFAAQTEMRVRYRPGAPLPDTVQRTGVRVQAGGCIPAMDSAPKRKGFGAKGNEDARSMLLSASGGSEDELGEEDNSEFFDISGAASIGYPSIILTTEEPMDACVLDCSQWALANRHTESDVVSYATVGLTPNGILFWKNKGQNDPVGFLVLEGSVSVAVDEKCLHLGEFVLSISTTLR
eukprot:824060_1